MFAAPTSVEDDRADFYTALFLANFEQIVTVLRVARATQHRLTEFDLSEVERHLDNAATKSSRMERWNGNCEDCEHLCYQY